MANWWTFKIISGENAGKTFKLRPDRTLLGRVKGDLTFSDDIEVSGVHAEISYDAAKGAMVLQDLKSRNGTRVNGEKVDIRVLAPGDRVQVGATEMVLEPPSLEQTGVRKRGAVPGYDVAVVVEEAPKKTPRAAVKRSDGSRPVPRAHPDRYTGLPTPRSFDSYLSRFVGVLFTPVSFLEHIGEDTELKPALRFGAINYLASGLISGILSYFFIFVWKLTPPGVDYGTSPAAIAIKTLLGLFAIPAIAGAFHILCYLFGGAAPFTRAVQLAGYMSAIHFVAQIARVMPKVGPFLGIFFMAYGILLWTIAGIRIYHVGPRLAYGVCSVIICFSSVSMVMIQNNAKRLGQEITLRELVDQKKAAQSQAAQQQAAAALASDPQPDPPTATPPAVTEQTSPAVEAQVAEAPAVQEQQRDPAANSDPQPPAAAADPAPPAMPQSADPQPPSLPSGGGGDPEPPSLPKPVDVGQ